jgi:phosphatidylglycerophosphatase A
VGLLTATGLGAGYSPVAPGTMGSIEGALLFIAIAIATDRLESRPGQQFAVAGLAAAILTALAIWTAGVYCRVSLVKDPQQVVIDEVAGQFIALLPLAGALSITGVVSGFVLFRAFDITKPYPVRRLEHLSGGKGVVLDDVMAGVYAGTLVLAGRLLHVI